MKIFKNDNKYFTICFQLLILSIMSISGRNIGKVTLPGFILWLTHCTLLLPPITVTGTKTAAEKQIIGTQTELEKDVWMISSAKTTASVDLKQNNQDDIVKQQVQEENSLTYRGFAIMDAFAQNLVDLKKDGVVGENKNGLLSNLLLESGVEISAELKQKYQADEKNQSYRTLVETVKQMNNARFYVVEGYILNRRRIYPEFNPDKNEILRNQKSQYQASSGKDEYIQQDSGEWIKKK